MFCIIVVGFMGMIGTPLGINYCNNTNSSDMNNQQCANLFPAGLNSTTGSSVIGNLTSPSPNGTGFSYLSGVEGFFVNLGQIGALSTQIIIQTFTTDFLFNFIGHVADVQFPPYFIATFHVVVILLLAVWLYYIISGRFASGGTI